MPALKNVKHELFAQRIATSPKTGLSQGQCYEAAGFKTNGRSADACAARLLTVANVQARIAELIEPTVRKTRATVDSLATQFDAVFDGAMGSAQFGAAGSAAAAKAKLLGFMREKIEVGSPGEFAAMNTVEQVVDAMLLLFDDPREALDGMRKLVEMAEERVANMATPFDAKSRARPSEADRSLALLRPGRR
jgi:hypothetical protein